MRTAQLNASWAERVSLDIVSISKPCLEEYFPSHFICPSNPCSLGKIAAGMVLLEILLASICLGFLGNDINMTKKDAETDY